MLVETKYKADDIVTISLISGQEVLGKFVSEDDDNIVLVQPLTIAMGPQGAAFQPFTITGESSGSVWFKSNKLVSVLKTNNDTVEAYRQATSSLVLPEKSGLIT